MLFACKSFIAISVLLLFQLIVFGQSTGSDPVEQREVVQSAINSNNLRTFDPASINVDKFTGTLQPSIKLFQVEKADFQTTLSIIYSNKQVQPDVHPSSVGLGWTLNAGGVVSRRKNDFIDEYRPNSYFEHYANPNKKFNPDEFDVHVADIHGTFFFDRTGQWRFRSQSARKISISHVVTTDLVISELTGASTIVPAAITKFVIQDEDGTQYEFGNDPNAIEFTRPALPTLIERANYFGPTGPGAYVRFCNGSINPCVDPATYVYSSSWHLTKVITPKRRSVNFHYFQSYSIVGTHYSNISEVPRFNSSQPWRTERINFVSEQLINSSYLQDISFEDGEVIQFKYSESKELVAPYGIANDFSGRFTPYQIDIETDFPRGKYFKLDQVSILDITGSSYNKVDLEYLESLSERLKLTGLVFRNELSNSTEAYSFEYNNQKLPAYYTGETDHWGYFNGQNFWDSEVLHNFYQSQQLIFPPDESAYYASRSPNFVFGSAELLNKIVFPTKGYVSFIFEPHSYRKYVTTLLSTSIVDIQSEELAGGVRIKEIISYNSEDQQVGKKRYHYNTNYSTTNNISSGVCVGLPDYFISGNTLTTRNGNTVNSSFSIFNTEPSNYIRNSREGHICYTTVVEEEEGNGSIETEFSNFDNGFNDKDAVYIVNGSINTAAHYNRFSNSRSFERGLPMTITYRDEVRSIRRRILRSYNSDVNRFNQYVIATAFANDIHESTIAEADIKLYYYTPFLEIEEDQIFSTETDFISKRTEYTYDDASKQIREVKTTNSSGDLNQTRFLYPGDDLTGDNAANHLLMLTMHVLNRPIEVTELLNGNVLRSERLVYDVRYTVPPPLGTGIVYLKSSFRKVGLQQEPVLYSSSIDNKGRVLDVGTRQQGMISYLYDDVSSEQIAIIQNSESKYCFFSGAESVSGWQNLSLFPSNRVVEVDRSIAHSGNFSLRLRNPSNSIGYVYSDKWINYSQLAKREVEFSGWVYSGGPTVRLILYMDDGNPSNGVQHTEMIQTTTNNAWVFLKKKIVVPSGVTATFLRVESQGQGDIWFDDLMIKPVDAYVTAFVGRKYYGIFSVIDPNYRIVSTLYDSQGRKVLEKDHDGNIINSFCYTFFGGVSPCTLYENDAQTLILYKNNCGGCFSGGQPYAVRTQKGRFYSVLSKADANSRAVADAQADANANGACSLPPNTSIYASNTTSTSAVVIFKRVCDSQGFTFNVNSFIGGTPTSGGVTLGNLPTGVYDISFSRSSGSGTNRYRFNSASIVAGEFGELKNVTIFSSSNNRVVITTQ